jgi:hypothetical protein
MSEGQRMTAPLYDASIPVIRQMLGVLAELLRKGGAHGREQGSDPETILEARLAPDMLTLMGQVQRASDHAKGAAARLAGFDPPSYADDERGLAEAHARITKTLDYIESLPRRRSTGRPSAWSRCRPMEDKCLPLATSTGSLCPAWYFMFLSPTRSCGRAACRS